MTATTIEPSAPDSQPAQVKRERSPWLNAKFITGTIIITFMFSLQWIGPLVWDVELARAASTPINTPPNKTGARNQCQSWFSSNSSSRTTKNSSTVRRLRNAGRSQAQC